jgi:hypothetical protein
MKLHLLSRYSPLGASSRLRFYQFLPFLRAAGIDAECSSFFDDTYLRNLYAGKSRNIFSLAKYYRTRRKYLTSVRNKDTFLIEYELFPHLPFFVENIFLRNRPYILNFDDAVHLHYQKLPVLKNKYPQLLANAAGIIAANDLLAEEFGKFNRNILKLPTIPHAGIIPGNNKPEKLTLVWTGTPVTVKFLTERAQAFQMAAKAVNFELIVVGANITIPGVSCRCIPWSEENEAAALKQAHAGIMPLPDTPFARGKSAYKLICYLRAGIPGIASAVGENCKVISDGINGFLAGDDQQWCHAIAQLARPEVMEQLAAGAAAAGKAYGLPENAEILKNFICRTFNWKN